MAMKRNEEWKQKEQEKNDKDELEEDDAETDDNEIEEKLLDESSTSGESEPEENDVLIVDKKYKPSCEFADDEAEESEIEDDDNEEEEEEEEDEEEEEEEEEEEGEEEEDENNDVDNEENNEDTNNESVSIKKKWKPKRIIQAFEDDSNLSSSKVSMDETIEPKRNIFRRTKTDVDMFETIDDNCQSQWNSDEENYASIFQKNNQQSDLTQICKTPLIKTNVLDFVSPITQLTILHANSNSSKKNSVKKEFIFANDSELCPQTPFDTSKNRFNINKRSGLQKKLFDDSNDVVNDVVDDEDLMQLCSGAFPSIQIIEPNPISSEQTSSLTTNKFNKDMSDVSKSNQNILLESDNSQDIMLYLEENSVSPSNTKDMKEENSKKVEAPWNKLSVVLSSDDENDSNDKDTIKIMKKQPKRLELSDDEEEDNDRRDNVQSSDEKLLKDDYIDYDSEENEVVVSKKAKNKMAAEFFEEEAELSESDWGSADEDEQDLDKLEIEEGDEDDIDENKVHNQLEKIHMKQMLDQDQREVRMLQELLFEDGDLHTEGSGRERKFKWKNIDKLGDNNDASHVNDDTDGGYDLEENENELEWRKLRHERDKFIEEKKKAVDEEIEKDLEKSEIFNFGVKLLKKKIESKQSEKQDSLENNQPMIEPIMPRNLTDLLNSPALEGRKGVIKTIMKKRSLLSRGEVELDRLAKRVRLNDTINLAPMNTTNFVFAHLTPSTKTTDDEENENIREENENESPSNEKTLQRRKRKTLASTSTTTPKRAMKQEGMDKKRKKIF
ncbi:hypothetical protein M0802_007156 [Mischocyttarus mexicanus]|nr:hypothetical protein M0802_007156 [Mischocyttarus mexicanus]